MTMLEMANMVVGLPPAGPAPTLTDSLIDELRHLAVQRSWAASLDAKIKAARAGFEATLAVELKNWEAAKRGVEAAESAVRALALVIHETTADTKPAPGVSIVQVTEYAIDDAAALVWCKAKQLCLVPESVDRRALQQLAKVTPLPFVTMTTRADTRIATDLFKVLPEVTS